MRYTEKLSGYTLMLITALLSAGAVVQQLLLSGHTGNLPYMHMRLAEIIAKKGIPLTVPFVQFGQPYILNLYDLLLSVYPSEQLVLLINLLSITGMIFFTYRLLKETGLPYETLQLSMHLLLISPAFLYLLYYPTHHVLGAFIILAGIYLYTRTHLLTRISSIALFLLIPFIGITHMIIALLLLAVAHRYIGGTRAVGYTSAGCLGAAGLLLYTPFFLELGIRETLHLLTYEGDMITGLRHLFSDMGSPYGFGIFSILLAITGFPAAWYKKRQLWLAFLAGGLILALTFLQGPATVYLNIFLAALAALGIQRLMNRTWVFEQVSTITLLLVTCGLLFSMAAYMDENVPSLPEESHTESLRWMQESITSDALILSYPLYSDWISYHSKRDVLFNKYHYIHKKEDINESLGLLKTQDILKSRRLLNRYNITHVWINKRMKEGLIWEEKDDGLLFLLPNNRTFKNIYERDGVSVWRIMNTSVQ